MIKCFRFLQYSLFLKDLKEIKLKFSSHCSVSIAHVVQIKFDLKYNFIIINLIKITDLKKIIH